MQRHDVASTLRRRYIYVMCPLGSLAVYVVSVKFPNSYIHTCIYFFIECEIPSIYELQKGLTARTQRERERERERERLKTDRNIEKQ